MRKDRFNFTHTRGGSPYATGSDGTGTDSVVFRTRDDGRLFFPQGVDYRVYMAVFADFGPQQEEKEVVLHITEVKVFERQITCMGKEQRKIWLW